MSPDPDPLLEEAARLLEQLEEPLLDKAADLLEDAAEPSLFDEDSIPDDTDVLFQQVDALVRQAEGSVQEESLSILDLETDPMRAAPPGSAPAAPTPVLQEAGGPDSGSSTHPRHSGAVDATGSEELPIDLDLVPTLMPGVRLAELSLTGLMMDDLFLVSQIDGKSTLRDLMLVTQITDATARKIARRLLDQGYISLQSRTLARMRLGGASRAVLVGAPGAAGGVGKERPGSKPDPARSPETAVHRTPAEQAADLYKRAVASYNQDRFSRAEDLLRACLSLVPNYPLYQARLAVVLVERIGRDAEALRLAEVAIEEDPLLGQAFEAKGLVKLKLGEIGDARRHLEKAMLLDRKRVPSSVAILAAMKTYKPKKGDPSDRLWKLIRPFVKLTP